MARAHLFRPITDREGNLLYNATVTVRDTDYSVPIGQPLYTGPTGAETLANPFTAVNGVIDFWLETPKRVSLLVQHSTVSDILAYLDAPPPPEEIVSSSSPLEIANEPTTSGQVLLSTATAGVAQWGNPPSGTGLTPVVVASSQSFNTGSDPVGWGFVQTNGGTHSYDPLTIPPETNYNYALKLTQAANNGSVTVTGPTFNLLESGRVSMWIKTDFSASESATVKVADAGAVQTTLATITTDRDWGFYSFNLAAGTWTPIIQYVGQPTFVAGTHSLWFAGYVAQYGGNIPAHNHNGAGTNSVALGTGATATATASTAVGANADATATNATAYGYNANATGLNSLAVGYNATAPTDYSMAIGSGAQGDTVSPYWVAMGYAANANGEEAVAVGKNAVVSADYGVAIGPAASIGASGTSAIAIGSGATANGANSVALGKDANVNSAHNNSVALGYNAVTTSANQVMMGHPGAITTITGGLQNYGLASLGGSAESRVGFYGSAGAVQQVVSGSDDGNVTLRSLIQALHNMGLIVNQTLEQPFAAQTPVGLIDYFYHQDPGDGSWGVADFDFAPYQYRPMAFTDVPAPASPQFFVGSDHNGYKGYAGGLGVMKNMYNPRHTFSILCSTTGTGNKICLTFRHNGAAGDAAACGYIILDQAAGTISCGTKAAGDPANVYTVAGGNSATLASIGATPFDGLSHSHLVMVSGTTVMYTDFNSTPIQFTVPALNLTGTNVGIDVNQTTTKVHSWYFMPQYTYDGFKTTGALVNAPSSEAWWPVTSGVGSGVTVNTAGNLQLTSVAAGHALAYVLTLTNSSAKVVRTRWNASITPTTAMGIVLRYVDASNYYFVNNSQITRVLAGVQTTLATLSSNFAVGDSAMINCWATGLIQVYRNGSLVGSTTDTTPALLASNRFGLGARGATVAGFQYFWAYDNYNASVVYK